LGEKCAARKNKDAEPKTIGAGPSVDRSGNRSRLHQSIDGKLPIGPQQEKQKK